MQTLKKGNNSRKIKLSKIKNQFQMPQLPKRTDYSGQVLTMKTIGVFITPITRITCNYMSHRSLFVSTG